MAKKLNALANDLAGISNAADSKVLALLQESDKKTGAHHTKVKRSESLPQEAKEGTKDKEVKEPRAVKVKPSKPKITEDWGRPTTHFSTRIPEEMSEMIDDLVYKLRKKGKPKTKQELAQEAIMDLLRKHKIC